MIVVGDVSGSSSQEVAEALATRIGYPDGAPHLKEALDALAPGGNGNVGLGDLARKVQELHVPTALKFAKSQFYKEQQAKKSVAPLVQQPSVVSIPVVVPASNPGDIALKKLGLTCIRLLGKGGFGQVYLGEDVSKNRYAVKLAESPQEAKAEYEVMRALSHPGIPKVRRQFEASLVMDFIVGKEVKSLIPTSVGLACEVGVAVANILLYMHKAEYVHGDIKPANVMIDQKGKYLLIDYGEAKKLAGDTQARQELIAKDVRMLGNLIRRCLLGNNVGHTVPWPKRISSNLRTVIDQARKENTQTTLQWFIVTLSQYAREGMEHEGVVEEFEALYGSASGIDDDEIADKVRRRLNPTKPPSYIA
ncbi:serine/threonine protein kinase [Hyalangium rubrum]|uniref:Protein kinase n=1 Tax=Hyalangium rubrum TaxID=3103134 RepID=A0ABU5GYD5_9BACT|nr:RIO1 family regulatory kinase/ATPase [Hyalangium sp. s54d21]MDY7225552.1 protein kinase [Hyalangium sp. s54d21]